VHRFGNQMFATFKSPIQMAVCLLFVMNATACTPTCEQTCTKLLSCEDEGLNTPMMNLDECTSSCAAQSNWYEDNQKVEQQDAFDQLKSCIYSETCESVLDGVCYDEDVYIW